QARALCGSPPTVREACCGASRRRYGRGRTRRSRRQPDVAQARPRPGGAYAASGTGSRSSNEQAFTQLGTIYQEQGRYKQAAYVYVRLLQLNPDSAAGRMQLSRAYAALGDQRRAAEQREIGGRLQERDQTFSHLSAADNHNA